MEKETNFYSLKKSEQNKIIKRNLENNFKLNNERLRNEKLNELRKSVAMWEKYQVEFNKLPIEEKDLKTGEIISRKLASLKTELQASEKSGNEV